MRRRALLGAQVGGNPPQPPFEDGTEHYPFLLRTADDFAAFQNQINAGDAKIGIYYKLVNDIDLAGKTFNAATTYRDFGGHFDGDYHVISNLTKNITHSAVFPLSQSATVKRLGFENINLSGQNPSVFAAGTATTEVREVYITGQIRRTSGNYCSPFGTSNCPNLYDCWTDVALSGGNICYGGIAALVSSNTIIQNCIALNNLDRIASSPGGIASQLQGNNIIRNCVAAMDIVRPTSGTEMGRIYTQRGGAKTGINNYALDTMLLGTSVVTNGTTTNKDGANATIEQLKSKEFYRDTMGWDMENIWTIDEGNDFPKLKGFIRRR